MKNKNSNYPPLIGLIFAIIIGYGLTEFYFQNYRWIIIFILSGIGTSVELMIRNSKSIKK